MKAAAFFDLDGTLLAVNSGGLWARRQRDLGRISRLQYLQAIGYLIAYRLHGIDIVDVTRKALLTVKGKREEDVAAETERWYLDEVAPRAAPGAWPAIEAHRQEGHLLVLLTSSSPYESAVATEHFALDAPLSSSYEVVDGVFTGEPKLPLCYGEGKIHYAERFALERSVDLDESYFYSDSSSDLPMLARVGNPRAVNPDPWLRLQAIRRGWPILDWRKSR